jgi:GT2 family glycosyltransferase
MDVSIVIPSYNTGHTLPLSLSAIASQLPAPEYEVIVVDCSSDDSAERALVGHERVQLMRRTQRFNPGEGRNIGARAATGRLLMFLDADVRLGPGAIQAAWVYFLAGHSMFGGALELDEMNATVASYLEHWFFNHEAQAGRPECARANLSSALMVVDRELFLGAGGFADIARMQDTELSERLRSQGVKLRFTPTVAGYQVQDSGLRSVLRKALLNGRNLYFIRYGTASVLRKASFLLLLPLMAAAKSARIIVRHLRYQSPRGRLITLLLAPLILLAGGAWMLGFYDALLFRRTVSQTR